MRRDQRGFTLMELMVVIVIVAILAAVAVPLYINYVQDAQRTEARGAIGAIITGQQAFFQRNGGQTYAQSLTELGYTAPATPPPAGVPQYVDISEADANWQFTVTGDQNGFTVQARGDVGAATGLGVLYNYTRAGGGAFTDN